MDSPSVTVSYRNEKADLQAAARLACRVVPALVRLRRVALMSAIVLVLAEVFLLAVGDSDSFVLAVALAALAVVMLMWASTWFWAWQSTRNTLSRRALGDVRFQADTTGITTAVVGSSGTHAWSTVDKVAIGDDSVIFSIGRQMYVYVPVRTLTETERATLRYLVHSSDGPEWVDLRKPSTGQAGTLATPG